jgi:hypothetical protein
VVFGLLFGIVAMQTLIVQSQRRIDTANARLEQERFTYDRFRIALAYYESPTYVVQRATALGLVRAEDRTYLVPSGDEALVVAAAIEAGTTEPDPATGAVAPPADDVVAGSEPFSDGPGSGEVGGDGQPSIKQIVGSR